MALNARGPGLASDLDAVASVQLPGHAQGRVRYTLKYVGVHLAQHARMHAFVCLEFAQDLLRRKKCPHHGIWTLKDAKA